MKRVALLATLASILYPSHSFVVPVRNGNIRHCSLPLAGLLDDYLSEGDEATADDSAATVSEESLQYEALFHSLIFSGDTRTDVAMQLEKCTDSKFTEYLQTTLNQSQDEEEKQGLQELMDLIAQVVEETKLKEQQEMEELNSKEAAKAQRQEKLEKEAKEKATAAAEALSMSTADVLKQANAIDEAVMTNVISDDEKPSDFISDCREVVNLSGGFNNQGQMRVGGR
mmetsp:Transcript_24061/g.58904  ORF Transcript_24061/g.58904 Transcript_24061/m.58904 type:complete len:227 (-) Transcript_24061:194-874(-)